MESSPNRPAESCDSSRSSFPDVLPFLALVLDPKAIAGTERRPFFGRLETDCRRLAERIRRLNLRFPSNRPGL